MALICAHFSAVFAVTGFALPVRGRSLHNNHVERRMGLRLAAGEKTFAAARSLPDCFFRIFCGHPGKCPGKPAKPPHFSRYRECFPAICASFSWNGETNVKNTLKQNHEFRRLYYRGKSASSRHVTVYVRRNGRPVSRTGLTVSTKLGAAVVRSRVKRLLREAWRSLQPELPRGYDVVMVARSACVSAKTPEVTASLRKALRAVGLLKGKGESSHPPQKGGTGKKEEQK